ncbi:MAG: eukaryotic-like serine/threonine-protein kinase [Acidobacteriota bacterium]|nr:eukaryotic-like serine/threonine-protein kinase [Acidobacteriota bacterium]
MGFGRGAMSVLRKVGIVLSVIIFFFFGLLGTVYLSLRTPEVKVPDIVGKDRYASEKALENAGLKIRVRGTTPSVDQKPDTVLNQVPEAGQVVKSGIEVAVQVSRAPKEGENISSSAQETKQEANKNSENTNANQTAATNQNQNQSKPKSKNKNSNNKNANNSNNANNTNANRNANNRNANTINRNANTSNGNRSTNTTTPNTNRSNANKRAPATTSPGANKGTP